MSQQPLKKAVSRAQFRYFQDALRRLEAGGESPIKGMTADDLRAALDGVDFNVLPERAQAVPKPRRQQAQPSAPASTHATWYWEDAISKNPELRKMLRLRGAVPFKMLSDGPCNWLLRDKADVSAVLGLEPTLQRSQLWTFHGARVFLAALGTLVRTIEEAAHEMAYCDAPAGGVLRREAPVNWPRRSGLPPELQDADY